VQSLVRKNSSPAELRSFTGTFMPDALKILEQIAGALLMLLVLAAAAEEPDPRTREPWRRRLFDAVAKLESANIRIAADLESAANSYISLRSKRSVHVRN
jgi:hypothetical protein